MPPKNHRHRPRRSRSRARSPRRGHRSAAGGFSVNGGHVGPDVAVEDAFELGRERPVVARRRRQLRHVHRFSRGPASPSARRMPACAIATASLRGSASVSTCSSVSGPAGTAAAASGRTRGRRQREQAHRSRCSQKHPSSIRHCSLSPSRWKSLVQIVETPRPAQTAPARWAGHSRMSCDRGTGPALAARRRRFRRTGASGVNGGCVCSQTRCSAASVTARDR